jgi:hypothetical protein
MLEEAKRLVVEFEVRKKALKDIHEKKGYRLRKKEEHIRQVEEQRRQEEENRRIDEERRKKEE